MGVMVLYLWQTSNWTLPLEPRIRIFRLVTSRLPRRAAKPRIGSVIIELERWVPILYD